MCTLSFRLEKTGFEVFFNRDEQHSRAKATVPTYYETKSSIFPTDPEGAGTWLAVSDAGLVLTLLNNYQNEKNCNLNNFEEKEYSSRGRIIIDLLEQITKLKNQVSLSNIEEIIFADSHFKFKPFLLVVFPPNLSLSKGVIKSYSWDGLVLRVDDISQNNLPISSSSINFAKVYQSRKSNFQTICDPLKPTSEELNKFHYSVEKITSQSVNMLREDARTVSISHIIVDDVISFEYFDNVSKERSTQTIKRNLFS